MLRLYDDQTLGLGFRVLPAPLPKTLQETQNPLAEGRISWRHSIFCNPLAQPRRCNSISRRSMQIQAAKRSTNETLHFLSECSRFPQGNQPHFSSLGIKKRSLVRACQTCAIYLHVERFEPDFLTPKFFIGGGFCIAAATLISVYRPWSPGRTQEKKVRPRPKVTMHALTDCQPAKNKTMEQHRVVPKEHRKMNRLPFNHCAVARATKQWQSRCGPRIVHPRTEQSLQKIHHRYRDAEEIVKP